MKRQFVLAVTIAALLVFAVVSSARTGTIRTTKVLFDYLHDPDQGSIVYIDPITSGMLSAFAR
jgi:hypothetical protein